MHQYQFKGADVLTAIYARQSVDRADSISIEQQIELCRYESRGEPCKVYADRGYSGKNTNRPQFSQMMNDIRSGLIRTVIVYKLDRISRSILDFSNMMEFFGRYQVQFISATEKFDTSSPMGNAMLNICIVFAQLERETIQKRVADAYYSRCRKSLYMGGNIPYGFRKVPAVIGGIHTSMYEPVPEEADTVRLIYEMYAQPDTSLGDIIVRLNDLGIRKRGKNWVRSRIRDILINPIYLMADRNAYDFFVSCGAVVVNGPADFIGENGCYCYKITSGKKKRSSGLKDCQIVIAPHSGIVESGIWLKCRKKCMSKTQFSPSQKAKNSWLCGKLKCGICGYALVAKRFNDRPDRYLLCSHKLNAKACCGAGTLRADEVEQIVYNEIKKKLSHFRTLSPPADHAPDAGARELENERISINSEICSLMDRVSSADPPLLRCINDRINALDERKNSIDMQLCQLKQYAPEPKMINNHLTVWDELSFDDKRRVTDALIRVIYATQDKFTILWKI